MITKMKNALRLLFCLLAIGWSGLSMAQAPTDNAYATFLDSRALARPVPHWTDSLPWSRVISIKNYQYLVRDTLLFNGLFRKQNWWYAFRQAQADAVAGGGGVIYFPRLPQRREDGYEGNDSSYYFSESLKIESNIILRGDRPHSDSANAQNRNFKLPTYLEFPKYDYVNGINRPGGTPNNTAFKGIEQAHGGVHNVAIVDLDINRAALYFQPSFVNQQVGNNNTLWAVPGMYNILILSVRSNNVAEPSPNVPSGNISSWHRWPFLFSANINLFVDRNAVVANVRLNDLTNNDNQNRRIEPDDFQQSGYRPNNTPGGQPLTGSQATFKYTDHYGIMINRVKMPVRGGSVSGFISYATQDQEPSLFAPGNMVHDSYIFKTQRVGIHIGGRGMEVMRNVIADDSNKFTFCDPTGVSYTNVNNPVADFANRGIEFGGWDAKVQYNDITVYRTQLLAIGPNARSADGDGFYSQAQGGLNPRNVTITHNKVRTSLVGLANAVLGPTKKGINGISLVNEVINLTIKHNDVGGTPIELNAGGGSLSNCVIDSNTNVIQLTSIGNNGGAQCYITNNTGYTAPLPLGQQLQRTIQRNCHVSLNPDPTNPANSNSNLTPNTCVPITNALSCLTPAPAVANIIPRNDTTVSATLTTFRLYTDFINRNTFGVCQFTNVNFYRDNQLLGPGTQDNFNPDRYYIDVPLTGVGSANYYHATGELTDGANSQTIPGTSVWIRQVVLDQPDRISSQVSSIYPNPGRDVVKVTFSQEQTGNQLTVRDMTGRIVINEQVSGLSTELDLSKASKGIYFVQLDGGKAVKLVVE